MDVMDGQLERGKPVHLFKRSPPSLFLHLYGRSEKCELSIRGRGWGRHGEGELGGGRQYDTVRREERGESETERSGEDRKHRRRDESQIGEVRSEARQREHHVQI